MKLKVFELGYESDWNGKTFPPHCVVSFSDNSPLTRNFKGMMSDILGFGKIISEGDAFYVECNISDNYIDSIKLLTPAISASIVESKQCVNSHTITNMQIHEVSFVIGSNGNHNIKSVQEQLNEKA